MAGVSSRAAERQSRMYVSIRWCQELGSELGMGSRREVDMMIREHKSRFVCIKFGPYMGDGSLVMTIELHLCVDAHQP
jgi:hypothetical protein